MIIPSSLLNLCHDFHRNGGRGLLVGGCVRDFLLGLPIKDYDLEVYGLSPDRVEKILRTRGKVSYVGAQFGVFKVGGFFPPLDVSLPRQETLTGKGHRDFSVDLLPHLSFKEASQRRDLTINSIGYDPLTQEILDPFGGQEDLKDKRLRATNSDHFSEDPLRGLRVAQFAARFSMKPDEELKNLCSRLDLSSLSGERLWGEWEKLFRLSPDPTPGIQFLFETGQWASLGLDLPEDRIQALSFLSRFYTPPRSEAAQSLFLALFVFSLPPIEKNRFFNRFKVPKSFREKEEIIQNLGKKLKGSSHFLNRPQAFCWAEKLSSSGLTFQDFFLWAEALPLSPSVTEEEEKLRQWKIFEGPPPKPLVTGQDLLTRGLQPGPFLGKILLECKIYQYASGETEKDSILKAVLNEGKESHQEEPS